MLKQNNMELKKQIDINNLQKVSVVSGSYKDNIGVVVDYCDIDKDFFVTFGDDSSWFYADELEVIEEEEELTVREVVEWMINQPSEYRFYIWEDFRSMIYDVDKSVQCETPDTLQQLTDLIRTKPTESELIEQFKSLSMEDKIKLMQNK